MKHLPMSRRTVLRGVGGAAVGLLSYGVCPVAVGAETITVGFIAVDNWQDYGYTQSHLECANALAKRDYVKILKEEGVPEAVEVQKAMKSMIELSGASIIVATAWGYYDPHVLKVAGEYPDVYFLHCGGTWEEGQPQNIATYFAHTDEVAFVAGFIAAKMVPDDKLGFLGSKPIPQILRSVNSFTLGAKLAKPSATTKIVLTGDWTNPVREAEATNSLIDQGIKAIGCDIDIPKVFVETCAKRQTYCIGAHVSQRALAPQFVLTGVEWNWITAVGRFVDEVHQGKPYEHNMRGGLAEKMVKMSPYGDAVPATLREEADELVAEITTGKRTIYQGELRDNKGNVVIPAGKTIATGDPALDTTEWLVEGVIGSTT